jgi:cytochrome P450 family 135
VSEALPGGPDVGPLGQTVALHRDPLGVLRRARDRHGDVFTLRLATVRPLVVVARLDEVEPLLTADPHAAHAGEARRRVLPLASRRSVFGSDGADHAAAHARVAAAFAPEAVAGRGPAIAEISARHVDAWPRGRPFGLLARMRAVVDEIFARLMLGIADEQRARAVGAAIQRMLWTPGNPPMTIPGEGDGLLGRLGAAVFERKRAPLTRLLREEIEIRRRDGASDADVLGRLIRAEPALSAEAIVDELLALLMAAQEPAASALTWLLERVARQPELATSLAAGDDSRDAIVRETLRLRPPAIAALRRLTAPRHVGNHRLPAGATVMVPIPLVHRDPRAHPDPDHFRPDRWRDGATPAPYLPFGGGARRCLGEFLSQAYFATLVPGILQRIRLRPVWPQPERMVLRGTILVPHRSGLVRAEPLTG